MAPVFTVPALATTATGVRPSPDRSRSPRERRRAHAKGGVVIDDAM